jgi:hypothetical protein
VLTPARRPLNESEPRNPSAGRHEVTKLKPYESSLTVDGSGPAGATAEFVGLTFLFPRAGRPCPGSHARCGRPWVCRLTPAEPRRGAWWHASPEACSMTVAYVPVRRVPRVRSPVRPRAGPHRPREDQGVVARGVRPPSLHASARTVQLGFHTCAPEVGGGLGSDLLLPVEGKIEVECDELDDHRTAGASPSRPTPCLGPARRGRTPTRRSRRRGHGLARAGRCG